MNDSTTSTEPASSASAEENADGLDRLRASKAECDQQWYEEGMEYGRSWAIGWINYGDMVRAHRYFDELEDIRSQVRNPEEHLPDVYGLAAAMTSCDSVGRSKVVRCLGEESFGWSPAFLLGIAQAFAELMDELG